MSSVVPVGLDERELLMRETLEHLLRADEALRRAARRLDSAEARPSAPLPITPNGRGVRP